MAIDVVMPQMGESIFEGTITRWLKKPGDAVAKDEPLFEISTDKVDAEIPAPVAGVLSEIKVAEGATVEINTVVAVIAEGGARAATATAGATKAAAADGAGAASSANEVGASGGANDAATEGGEVVMPQLGESIFEGTITKWLKKVGERVEKDEPLFEVSTDKVDAEIPSPVEGVLSEIKVAAGATVEINTVVAVIGGSGAGGASGAGYRASGAKAQAPATAAAGVPAAVSAEGRKIRSSPLVRRIAKENHVDLARVAGTGSEGRITRDDILKHLREGGKTAGAAAAAAAPMSGELVPMTKMRSIIARRMLESVQTSPHVYTVYRVDMTRVVKARERARAGFEQKHGFKLTFMPFIATAVVEGLRKFPVINAAMEGDSIRYHKNVNLGIAVALDWGLIVPVVTAAEQRDFGGLAAAIADLAERARTKKLKPEEATGSTITLTNSGVFGDEFSTPIINQPEAAILCISGIRKEPVVVTDAEGNDTIAIRAIQHFSLGFDHRIIDGADACRFMAEFKKTLENWNRAIG
jgi:2-oxoglutarate dehydrogenase E2 component (dihydrolipoamide succinyltransferase)